MEAIRAELTKAEALLRDANEKELPEEKFRLQVEAKREELSSIMEKFSKMNVKEGGGVDRRHKTNKDPWSPEKDHLRAPRFGGMSSPKTTGRNNRNWNEVK